MSGDLGNSYNIDIWGLLIALGMVAVAAIISELMHMGIGKTLMWSSCRALVQLCAMGFIIGYVIRSNSVWMVFALMAVMLVAAVQIVMSRARGIPKGLAGPIFLSLVITMLLMLALVTELIVRPAPVVRAPAGGAPDRHAAGQHRNRLGGGIEPFLREHGGAA
ncbi:putative membrane spanning protein [Bifidobacterium longum subsp. longum]|nr:putative membrane spanning protein [Bifidobacterium longum subsp. longum]